ncbi:hypothetical protein SAMN00120144_1565 [Hymenobacter roseosalivarius DSM 11622]|uniref:Lipoprotein n=1 Tax=Hymenobacter roseosalivarius DSM 11622 TaxID=645990 RepID=A0A1W1VW62_9BACT|nr:hypothetical protein [Hymenobacter roseosalivarius]SMB97609.1 hypothetical protein SAMN00120144_1565 [Hymenobacter roseosalivarius DSM 11622]
MKNWLLLILLSLILGCTKDVDVNHPKSVFYQQQEDSVLIALCGQVINNETYWFSDTTQPIVLDQFWPYRSLANTNTVDIKHDITFPASFGILYKDLEFRTEDQRKYARKEAYRLTRSPKLDSAFALLFLSMWDPKNLINKTSRLIPYHAMEGRLDYPSYLLPSYYSFFGENESSAYYEFSRGAFNQGFTKGAFQVHYSDPGVGRVLLYCIEKYNGKWRIIASEVVASWKY